MTDSEILALIKEVRGVSIHFGRNIQGGEYWSVIGGDINSGGQETMDGALQKWAEHQKWYNENKERLDEK